MPPHVLIHSWRDLEHPEAGGAERYIVEIAEGLAARGHEVTIRTAWYPGAARREVHHGVTYERRGGRMSIYPWALAGQLGVARRPDVVIDVQNGMPYFSPLVRRGPVVNLVHHVHREQWPILFGPRLARLGWWLESTAAPRVYRHRPYVTVSASTHRELREQGVDGSRMRIIPNGTEQAPQLPVTRSTTPRLIVLGRLVPQKRVEVAIEAVAALRHRWPDVHLDIVGSGWWLDELVARVRELGVEDSVTFHGHVSELEKHRLLGSAWVHLLPSVKEGWGLVVVEAGVHGTPTVAFREAGGPVDSVRHGRTGLLIDGGAGDFADSVGALLADDDLRRRMDRAVRSWVAQFHWERSVDAWEDLLSEVSSPKVHAPELTVRRS